MAPTRSNNDPASSRTRLRRITPEGEEAEPWLGLLVDPRDSQVGSILREPDTGHYVIVRCIDTCAARGLVVGDDYLVLARYVGAADAAV